eukprot:TRINITY_DN1927_c0_g1_i2.p1 TRINITY_DN1927_c0_g1~~TRINITY_DN1927_c0_g1_i2.p1  ORF type:complete len:105 (+),score=21.13 TRINITY_DN1927_c0_g1_i2:50-364(+)
MGRLSNGDFLKELTKLYDQHKTIGSVWVTFKKIDTTPIKGKQATKETETQCLVRATDGKNKISTIVNKKDLVGFQVNFNVCMKANVTGLKKRETTKKKTTKKTV